jgi:hypothetical protein
MGAAAARTGCCRKNGYFVQRSLAEDVGKDLDRVLDATLRVLGRRS